MAKHGPSQATRGSQSDSAPENPLSGQPAEQNPLQLAEQQLEGGGKGGPTDHIGRLKEASEVKPGDFGSPSHSAFMGPRLLDGVNRPQDYRMNIDGKDVQGTITNNRDGTLVFRTPDRDFPVVNGNGRDFVVKVRDQQVNARATEFAGKEIPPSPTPAARANQGERQGHQRQDRQEIKQHDQEVRQQGERHGRGQQGDHHSGGRGQEGRNRPAGESTPEPQIKAREPGGRPAGESTAEPQIKVGEHRGRPADRSAQPQSEIADKVAQQQVQQQQRMETQREGLEGRSNRTETGERETNRPRTRQEQIQERNTRLQEAMESGGFRRRLGREGDGEGRRGRHRGEADGEGRRGLQRGEGDGEGRRGRQRGEAGGEKASVKAKVEQTSSVSEAVAEKALTRAKAEKGDASQKGDKGGKKLEGEKGAGKVSSRLEASLAKAKAIKGEQSIDKTVKGKKTLDKSEVKTEKVQEQAEKTAGKIGPSQFIKNLMKALEGSDAKTRKALDGLIDRIQKGDKLEGLSKRATKTAEALKALGPQRLEALSKILKGAEKAGVTGKLDQASLTKLDALLKDGGQTRPAGRLEIAQKAGKTLADNLSANKELKTMGAEKAIAGRLPLRELGRILNNLNKDLPQDAPTRIQVRQIIVQRLILHLIGTGKPGSGRPSDVVEDSALRPGESTALTARLLPKHQAMLANLMARPEGRTTDVVRGLRTGQTDATAQRTDATGRITQTAADGARIVDGRPGVQSDIAAAASLQGARKDDAAATKGGPFAGRREGMDGIGSDLEGKEGKKRPEDKEIDEEGGDLSDLAMATLFGASLLEGMDGGDEVEEEEDEDKDDDVREKYKVQPGDTLASIARTKLKDKALASLIYEINKKDIPTVDEDGKTVIELKPDMILLLPSQKDIQRFKKQLFTTAPPKEKKAEKKIYATPEEELAAKFGAGWDGAAEGKEESSAGDGETETLEELHADALAAAATRRENVESLLGPLKGEEQLELEEEGIKYVVRLGDTLKSVAIKHPALGDVRLWQLLAETNDLSTETDEKGHPLASIRRGQSLIVPEPHVAEKYLEEIKAKQTTVAFSKVSTKTKSKTKTKSDETRADKPDKTERKKSAEDKPTKSVDEPPEEESSDLVPSYAREDEEEDMAQSLLQAVDSAADPGPVFGMIADPSEVSEETRDEPAEVAGLKTLNDEARLFRSDQESSDSSDKSIWRLEFQTGDSWSPVVTYEVYPDVALRHEYKNDGSRKSIRIDLPPSAVQELADNDLSSNWQDYLQRYKEGRTISD